MTTKTRKSSGGPSISSVREWLDNGGHQNGLLRAGEWAQIDTAVLDVVRTGLVGITDLVNAGLTHPLGGLGTVLSGYEQISDLTEADVSIDGTTEGSEDDIEFSSVFVPVPIIHKDFSLSLRKLLASRNSGEGLDVTQARTATRIVRQKMESMLFNGISKQLGAYPIYGYTNAPHRITGTAFGDFGTSGNAYKTFVKALTDFSAKGFQGPFNFYVANPQYMEMLNLIGTFNGINELKVVIDGMPQIASIKPSFDLAAGNLVGVQMTSDVVDLAVAEDITPLQWEVMGGMKVKFRVMAALAPRIKFDANETCGVLHYTGA
jgi:uncharacterized linocin/CFP29 family protein